jgi:ribosomal protein L40E
VNPGEFDYGSGQIGLITHRPVCVRCEALQPLRAMYCLPCRNYQGLVSEVRRGNRKSPSASLDYPAEEGCDSAWSL